ncbi:hypothetical protein CERSUDRAFT_122492 [Gelatoporia subvermispora B]|uniref:Uncharacterized protein n=1 Tax=Ceriporiopsis subvermispora (strain B) TaxID=914234 RepID=M2RKK7_CERS8|nr:hypothetical protein CERSUDRAFT_122492 [Gelatoporia subvermispora B]
MNIRKPLIGDLSIRKSSLKRPAVSKISSMRRAMGLTEDGYTAFSTLMRSLLEKHCDISKPYSQQSFMDLKRLRDEALVTCPLLDQYEDRWPLDAWIKWRMHSIAHNSRRRDRRRRERYSQVSYTCLGKVVDNEDTNWIQPSPEDLQEHISHKPSNKVEFRIFTEIQNRTPSRSAKPMTDLSGGAEIQGGQTLSYEGVSNSSDATTDSQPRLMGPSSNDLLEFLRSLVPNLGQLETDFKTAGVKDGDDFRGLVEMPESERNKFLKDDMGLSCFHTRVLAVGFAKLGTLSCNPKSGAHYGVLRSGQHGDFEDFTQYGHELKFAEMLGKLHSRTIGKHERPLISLPAESIAIKRSAIAKPSSSRMNNMRLAMGIDRDAYTLFSVGVSSGLLMKDRLTLREHWQRVMRKYLKEFCDMTRKYDEQPKEQLRQFRQKALQHCPMLSHYEDRWPLEAWAKRTLYWSSWNHAKCKKQKRAPAQTGINSFTDMGDGECYSRASLTDRSWKAARARHLLSSYYGAVLVRANHSVHTSYHLRTRKNWSMSLAALRL